MRDATTCMLWYIFEACFGTGPDMSVRMLRAQLVKEAQKRYA